MKYLLVIIMLSFFSNAVICQYCDVSPKQVIINEDCNEQLIDAIIELWGSPREPIEVFNLRSDLCEAEFFYNGKKLENNDTLLTSTDELLKIQLSFKNYDLEEKVVSFSTPYEINNPVELNLGSYYISHEEVKSVYSP